MVEVIGYKYLKGISKKTNKPYSGYMIWYTEQQRGVTGLASDSAFVPDDLLCAEIPDVGTMIELRYNKTGFLEEVSIVG